MNTKVRVFKKKYGHILLILILVLTFWPINFPVIFLINRRETVALQLKIRDNFALLFREAKKPPERDELVACLNRAIAKRGIGLDGEVFVSGSDIDDMCIIIQITSPGPLGYNVFGAWGILIHLSPSEIEQKKEISEKLEF